MGKEQRNDGMGVSQLADINQPSADRVRRADMKETDRTKSELEGRAGGATLHAGGRDVGRRMVSLDG